MSAKFFEKALATLKKANLLRRLKLAVEAGFPNVETYQLFLEGEITRIGPSPKEAKVKTEKTKKKEKVEKVTKEETPELTDMVIAFDTTGSMRSYIDNVKKHVTELIPNLFKQNPNLNISIVAFGDYCDMISKNSFGNAYQFINLTSNENELIGFVSSAKDTAGGDEDEFYELVIKKITEDTSWREGSNKSVLFIADCGPHPVGYTRKPFVTNSQIDWKQEAKKAANLGVKFDTLRIHNHFHWYKELSEITGGVCLDFKSSGKTSQVVEAAMLARGGAMTMDAFMSKSTSAEVKADAELNAVYTMYKTTVKK